MYYLEPMFEHLGISLAAEKIFTYNPQNSNSTTVLNHNNCNERNATLENFRITGSARNNCTLCLKESLLIQRYKFNLNKKVKGMPIYLFN